MNALIIGAAVCLLALVLLAAFDVFWPTTVVVVLALISVWWHWHVGALLWLLRPVWIGGYVVAGFLWVFFRWTQLVDRELARSHYNHRLPPKWSAHSYDFAPYFFYWPIDVAAYLLSDFLRQAWEFLARMVAASFDQYAEWRFKKAQRSHSDREA